MTVSITNVNRGLTAGDGTGDTAFVGVGKLNDNDNNLKQAVEALQAMVVEHIDWTSASQDFKTSGAASIGGKLTTQLISSDGAVGGLVVREDSNTNQILLDGGTGATEGGIEFKLSDSWSAGGLYNEHYNEHWRFKLDVRLDTLIGSGNRMVVTDATGKLSAQSIPTGVTDHTLLTNIGTNTHTQIDSHIALVDEHIDWTVDSGSTIHSGNYVDTTYDNTDFVDLVSTQTVGGVKTFSNYINTSNIRTSANTDQSLALIGGNKASNGAQIVLYSDTQTDTNYNNAIEFKSMSGTTIGGFSQTLGWSFDGNVRFLGLQGGGTKMATISNTGQIGTTSMPSDAGLLKQNGSRPLTGNWDVGAFTITTKGLVVGDLSGTGTRPVQASATGLLSAPSGYDRASSTLSGANVFSNIVVANGLVTSTSTRALTAANIGAATAGHTHPAMDSHIANIPMHRDWSVSQGATKVHADNYIDTTYGSSDFVDLSSNQASIYGEKTFKTWVKADRLITSNQVFGGSQGAAIEMEHNGIISAGQGMQFVGDSWNTANNTSFDWVVDSKLLSSSKRLMSLHEYGGLSLFEGLGIKLGSTGKNNWTIEHAGDIANGGLVISNVYSPSSGEPSVSIGTNLYLETDGSFGKKTDTVGGSAIVCGVTSVGGVGKISFHNLFKGSGATVVQVETMTISNSSKVGILQPSPQEQLDVNGNVKADAIRFGNGTDLLDYYEVGTWTPLLIGSGGGTPTDYGSVGKYVINGDTVTINGFLRISAKNALSGSLYLSGIPAVAKTTHTALNIGFFGGVNFGSPAMLVGWANADTKFFLGRASSATGVRGMTDTHIDDSFFFYFSATYQAF